MDAEKRYWRERYDETAAQCEEDWRVGRWGSQHYYKMVQTCLDDILAPLEGSGLHALDVCCGSGALLELLHARDFHAFGLDNSMGVLQRLKTNPERRTLRVLQADASRIPFPDASFDLIVSIGMLQCFPGAGAYLTELARVLAPHNSRLLLLFSPDAWLVNRRREKAVRRGDEDIRHYRLHRVETVAKTLRSLRFDDISDRSLYYVFYAPILRPFLRFANRNLGQAAILRPLATSSVIIAQR